MLYKPFCPRQQNGMQNGGLLMADKIKKDIIHAKGYDIGIYTTDYENEFISITDTG